MTFIRFISAAVCTLQFGFVAAASDSVPLIDPNNSLKPWGFHNGGEFPGATGEVTVDEAESRGGLPALKLVGDFTKGGLYVSTGRKLDNVDIRELAFWIRYPGADKLTIRIGDASDQTHQIGLKLTPSEEWQRVVLPLEEFFAKRGQAGAVTGVSKYESWGGAKDGAWHGPATGLHFLIGKGAKNEVRTLWLREIVITPRPVEVPGAEIKTTIKLAEILEGEHDWRFSKGEEFKGAAGSLTVDKDDEGQPCLKLAGNFTGGGAYVAAIKSLTDLAVKEVSAIRLKVKSDNATSLSLQLVDGTGQTHQRKGREIIADGQWHELVVIPAEIAGGEHWGGANDAKWHGAPRLFVLSLTSGSDPKEKQPVIYLADVRANALLPVFAQPAAFTADFEHSGETPVEWTTKGTVKLDARAAFKGAGSLSIARTLDNVEQPCTAVGPTFTATPGQWQISLACKSDLHSPDNSYNSVMQLECLDSAGKLVERFTVAEIFGKRDWQDLKKRVELPAGVASARFQVQLNKTYGSFWIDDVTASYLAPAPNRDDRIVRMMFATSELGNLLFPDSLRTVNVTVETRKPLRASQQTVSYIVRDYWGAEQTPLATATLSPPEKKQDRLVYQATLDLKDVPLELGRYYELHGMIAQEGDEPFRNYTSLAILPPAESKKYQPEEIPFTSRNWDNRIGEYIRLSDRLGVRICGLWGGWSSKPPYQPEAPGLDLCKQLGMGWLTTTPCATIERGKTDYSEDALRQGVRNLIETYGGHRPLIINLGNEPHGTGERVLKNVAAYKVVYEEVKKVDPAIQVVATSVEPNEEYFRAGYGQWCDAYDFHIYEDSANVRRTMAEYRELARKYGVEKPIWSTELGLNSQGLTRHVVAVELYKKTATFFAAGGKSMSWFGLLYPDAEGKDHGSSGSAHNVFDCRYNRYCPKLDAIAYYNAVNSIGIKKFVAEKQYTGGINAFLFRDRDDHALQILWKDKGRQDVFVPLEGIDQVQVIRIDGSRRQLHATRQGVTLTVSEDPLLLHYEGENTLPTELGSPKARIVDRPAYTRNGAAALTVELDQGMDSKLTADLIAPPLWKVERSDTQKLTVSFSLAPPRSTAVRELDLIVLLHDSAGHARGELYRRSPR